jgi:Sulfite exporter TauE/SafE
MPRQRGGWQAHDPGMLCSCTTEMHEHNSHAFSPVDTMTRILITAALLSLCAFMRSAVGFGEALLAIPLLSMIMSISTASPVVTLAGLTMSLSMLVANRETVDFSSARRLIVASLVGIPFGGSLGEQGDAGDYGATPVQ